ncbi:putative disease resistance protein At3g14460 [Durio zibethinus]|uniref:Disease resistance protein At3g14460 n=1 Tax=Durio zibethinus TaxID=66656 RepID=A0A6P6AIS6_DURZI|nr:putative disease resistance protein At3g14460 [Durio zibethinus]
MWLADLKDLAYDLDDILDEFSTEALGRKLVKEHQDSTSMVPKAGPTGFHSSSIMFNYKMMSKIKEITRRLEGLATQKSNLQLMEISVGRPTTIPKRPPSTSLVNETYVRGRNKEKQEILDLVLSNNGCEGGVSVIPIVGMGGIGKTTLAQLVYNDDSIKDHFDLTSWVCVSNEFDVVKITKAVLQSVTSEPCDEKEFNLLQVKLKEKLSGKKFLLVLDDVWNQNYSAWLELRPPFDTGVPGSKIIVTTRSFNVSSVMRTTADYSLQYLSNEDSLSVLAHHALDRGDFTEHPDLEEIGLEIVKKCGGLPLATITIAGLLRTRVNHDAWKAILESDIWNLPEEKSNIVPALLLSYYSLSSQLKQCLAYCSLFPKDYEFSEEETVQLWMAEGFLNGAERRIEDLGRECFEELVSRSFFQASSKAKSLFVMHDLINDLAQSVAGETYFKRERNEGMENPSRTRHSSYIIGDSDGIKKFETFFEAKSLRTFLPFDTMQLRHYNCFLSNNVLSDLLPRLKCLRVLSLKRYHISEIPDFIGILKHLRYLDFSYTGIRSLPDSLCTLYNLETLLLRVCKMLEKLPSEIGILKNLCHLDINGAVSIKEMPSGIGELTNIRALSDFIIGQGDGLNIREMQNLSNLKGRLCISELHNVDETEYVHDAKLSSKSGLDNLELKWSKDFNEDLRKKEVETEVLNLLQPHKDIKELAIKHYAGILLPIWIGDPSFEKLRSLKFEDCRNCELLPAVGKLPFLKDLYIKGMSSVISVGKEFYGDNCPNVFPLLETLQFDDMAGWEEWEPCEGVQEGRNFSCLQKLFIENCPKLVRTLPDGLRSLEKLVIRNCQELVVSISNLPKLYELEIQGCGEVVLGSSSDLWSVKKIFLLDIAKFECVTKEMMMLESMKVEDLSIDSCEELASLLQTKWGWLASLRSLRNLQIQHCPQIVSMGAAKEEQAELSQLDIPCNIEYLTIQVCEGLEKLSATMQNLSCLRKLELVGCPKLVSLLTDNLPPTLKSLEILGCENLICLLDDREDVNFSSTSLLESLEISNCEALKSLSSSGKLPIRLKSLRICCPGLEYVAHEIGDNICLESIELFGCTIIKFLPQGLDRLSRLQNIHLGGCSNLDCFPASGLPASNFKFVILSGCLKLEVLPNFYSLQELWIINCPMMKSIGEAGLPTNLTSLIIDDPNFSKAVMEWGLHRLASLKRLRIDGGDFIDVLSFPHVKIGMNMKLPPSLTHLEIGNFKNLRKLSFKGFQNLTFLQYLSIEECPKLKSLPKKEMLPSLLGLFIESCPVLTKRYRRDKGKLWSNIAHIPCVRFDDEFQ